mmetsp:Transcript_15111/g.21089  ORF Transcript_15111/g.21089 Transcript_15111/m.21089 type:complete len:121 (-) Transcript_15111:12-374(-)
MQAILAKLLSAVSLTRLTALSFQVAASSLLLSPTHALNAQIKLTKNLKILPSAITKGALVMEIQTVILETALMEHAMLVLEMDGHVQTVETAVHSLLACKEFADLKLFLSDNTVSCKYKR